MRLLLLAKLPLFVLAGAWGIVAIFVVLLPCEVIAAACFLAGQKSAGNECMETAFGLMYGPLEWVADL